MSTSCRYIRLALPIALQAALAFSLPLSAPRACFPIMFHGLQSPLWFADERIALYSNSSILGRAIFLVCFLWTGPFSFHLLSWPLLALLRTARVSSRFMPHCSPLPVAAAFYFLTVEFEDRLFFLLCCGRRLLLFL